jgi:hypothetical protein
MSSIYISTVPSPSLSGVARIDSVPPAQFSFSAGDVFEAAVVEKAGRTEFLLTIKDASFLADSDLPLKVGEKLLVRVEQLKPQIVLRVVDQEEPLSPSINSYLKLYRANPDVLMDIFKKGNEIFNKELSGGLLPESIKAKIDNILRIIDTLVFSQGTSKNALFIKDYVYNLGILLECDLLKTLQGRGEQGKEQLREGLKGVLLRLSEELNFLLKNSELAGNQEEIRKLTQLAKFAETSVKAIEIKQLINIFYQENEGGYMLQVPLLFPDGIRTGEIFIESREKGSGSANKNNVFHVAMFLSMDALGDMMIEATLTGVRINCVFKFEDGSAKDFFSSFLEGLSGTLCSLGYECEYMTCVTDNSLNRIREEYQKDLIYDQIAVNLFV